LSRIVLIMHHLAYELLRNFRVHILFLHVKWEYLGF